MSKKQPPSPRPGKLASTKSFSRYEPGQPPTPTRSRASTLSGEVLLPAQEAPEESADHPLSSSPSDVFEKKADEKDTNARQAETSLTQSPDIGAYPEGFDELPIELISLTDRFIASLITAKIYPTPPSIDKLSDLFQDFYAQAEAHISTHIQILSSRQYRDASPARSVSSRTTRLNSKTSKDTLDRQDVAVAGRQMLTSGEITERRKARRLLEHKRVALEEAVERRACEGIYDRIWRHKSSMDELRDEKLRSKTAALAVVGIGLKDLGIELDAPNYTEDTLEARAARTDAWVSKARQGLLDMNQSHSPLGKLQCLASSHQCIVDLLTDLHQASSSADEILPTLIYTLIQSPPEGINIISNLYFIQRFRSAGKINGEAAYCLTNLEAAITFLETVDLASLRAEEAVETRSRSSSKVATTSGSIPTPADITSPGSTASPITTPLTAVPPHMTAPPLRPSPSFSGAALPSSPASPSHQRHLSSLFQPPAALSTASDAVFSTADQGFRNISTALDSSFKLLFGRLKEQNLHGTGTDSHGGVILPKTLDEARRMVSPKAMVDDDGNLSETSSFAEQDEPSVPKEDRILDMITGSRVQRDRSVDSAGSGSRRVALAAEARASGGATSGLGISPPAAASAAVESMRNLGNSLNPLNRFGGINVMRGFGRTASSPPVASPAIVVDQEAAGREMGRAGAEGKVDPPVQRFLHAADAGELRLGEVEVLLKDYQRLAGVMKGKGLF